MPTMRAEWMAKGAVANARRMVLSALATRFGTASPAVSNRVEAIEDLAVLEGLHQQAITVASLEEFQAILEGC